MLGRLDELMSETGRAVNDALIAIAVFGLLAGGAIVAIDSLILRRIRRQRTDHTDDESASGTPRH